MKDLVRQQSRSVLRRMQKVILSHSLTIARASKVLIHCLHYKLLAETMHDVSNDLVPSNLKEVFLPTAKVHSYNTR